MASLLIRGVAVEKVTPGESAQKALRSEARQATFASGKTFSIPEILAVLGRMEFFNSHNATALIGP
jgi:hypothetical protein